ncbi:non-ribosomal peptide synthetase [Hydrococcus rivularis NIES-593]|uniref:Non-ribosomal peptide synthetase n=1 Tax=Hydrococcus rivularis NIES-593 TaxID=1921803 RepID=A0A1U7HBD5_9CYAN|nr:non-ribosomal peptide synthetase [Hydrococcus rivularis]OKH20890.1 non-ribosomal peptide synthetase [Hydrococcus rivularis NIES-593]
MSNLLKRIENLSPEKRELLLQKLNQQKGNISPTKIEPQNRDTNTFPLSFAQTRLWFFAQLEPDSYAYNIPTAVRLTGALDVPALSKSINAIAQRHEALRTNFTQINGQPVQIIRQYSPINLPVIDLQALPPTQQQEESQRIAREEAEKPFNLEKDCLLRFKLLRLAPDDYIVLFTTHHIISDAWSTGILIQELVILYKAFCAGQPSPLPDFPIQYADFAVWQRKWLQGEVLQSQLNYWKQQLGNAPAALELPTDRPRPSIQSDRGAIQSLILSQSLTRALKDLSQQEGVTLFMTLLAAFKVLLYRYTGQQDIAIGTPIANRNRTETEELIGFFVNTLVLRTNLQGNPSFRQLLKRVREVTLGAYAHQDLPFEQLVEEIKPERDLSHSSLFQVMFILQNAPMEALELPGLTLNTLPVESVTANFDLTLSMSESDRGLIGWLEYNTDLFDATTIARMLGHFQTLLESIVTNCDRTISDLPILTDSQRQQLLVEFNQSKIQNRKSKIDRCIHTLFEQQVKLTPNAIAVVYESEQLTYLQLNAKANQLARFLRSLGVKPETLVGLCVERSLDLVVGVLGILKAGGAYLPLDPAYPQERLAFMLADAQVSVLVTQTQLTNQLPTNQAAIVTLEDPKIAQQEKENLVSEVTPENLAYVIYTSGSTGQAKGVMVCHRNLVNAYFAWEEAYRLREVTSHLQMASFSFDVFAGDLVRALCSGGKLVLCPKEILLEPQQLYQLMVREKVDCAEFVPVVLRNLIQYLESSQQRLDFMRLLICGSDSWYVKEYEQFRTFCGSQTRLINSFGLTEATIDSSYFEAGTVVPTEKLVPIGSPFTNTQIYILDSYFQPVPIGVIGELYIGGLGLARGYLNRADLTAQKFIPNPFSTGTRLYKTGDMGRYLSDGNIELLGRTDHQVKIRGFRVELGEIEAVLRQHPTVRETAVLVRNDLYGNSCLVAYIVSNSDRSNVTLKRFLQERLPNYMVPSAFVWLESLPLTPNGKIDRHALPIPERELEETFIAPRTELEKVLANLWTQILGVENIGIHDNFFELGGHSLLTTQLMVKIREAFRVDMPLRILFESPTIASLAESLEQIFKAGLSHTLSQETILDLNAEAVLDDTIFPENNLVELTTDPNSIFLTGATGFLGAFLLYELLQQTQANIYCLVRASNLEEGKNKLQKCLESYLIWQESFSSRIVPVIGDLSKPLLGLSQENFHEIAQTIDLIYHNGAWVHHIYPYSVLKAANVLGTQEVLRLACQSKTKPVHFISTSSVFCASNFEKIKVVKEGDSFNDFLLPDNGYVQTKWVSEKLIKIAQSRGLPISIYRLGRVSGHSQTGVFNANDFLYRLIVGCVRLGIAPEGDIMEDIMPVDYVSRAIAHLSRQTTSLGKAFHLVNPQLLHSDMLIDAIHSLGYPLQQVSYDRWREKLIEIATHSPEHPLYPLVPFFPARESQEKPSGSVETRYIASLQFDCHNTLTGLAGTEIACPAIDKQLLATYLAHLAQGGFLNPPSSHTQDLPVDPPTPFSRGLSDSPLQKGG